MKITDIKIIKDNSWVIEVKEKPSKLTFSFLSQIMHSDFFNSEINELMISWTLSTMTYKDIHSEGTKIVYDQVKFDISFITSHYDLPIWFTWQFFILLYCKCFFESNR